MEPHSVIRFIEELPWAASFVLELSSQTQQSGIIDLKGFPVPQTFARSFIQFVEDGLYVFLSDISQILPFGKVFP